MGLGIRKIIIIGLIGAIFLAGNVLLIANWLSEKGVPEKANWLRINGGVKLYHLAGGGSKVA